MRLSKTAQRMLFDTATRALSTTCNIDVRARDAYSARRIFDAATPHLGEFGAKPDRGKLAWNFPNGSCIRIVVDGKDA